MAERLSYEHGVGQMKARVMLQRRFFRAFSRRASRFDRRTNWTIMCVSHCRKHIRPAPEEAGLANQIPKGELVTLLYCPVYTYKPRGLLGSRLPSRMRTAVTPSFLLYKRNTGGLQKLIKVNIVLNPSRGTMPSP